MGLGMSINCQYCTFLHNEPAALMLIVALSLLYSCVNLTHKKTEHLCVAKHSSFSLYHG